MDVRNSTVAFASNAPVELKAHFYTTNLQKYLQARTIFERHGLRLSHLARSDRAYNEDYSGTKEQLLANALQELIQLRGAAAPIFIEDTSVRIEALSTEGNDFPGLEMKEWFEETSFRELDEELGRRGNDRSVLVSSDIALHLPGLPRPVFFTGTTYARVAEDAPSEFNNSRYPWLTSRTFNGWIVPIGAVQRLGEMSLDDSLPHDFRSLALTRLAERLQEYNSVLTVRQPQRTYHRQLRPSLDRTPPLFDALSGGLMVTGYSCAGKTTFGDFAEGRYAVKTFEASHILRDALKFDVEPGIRESPFLYAQAVLNAMGADVVARRILDVELNGRLDEPFIITGFRTLEEVLTIRSHVPRLTWVWIEASERTRFQRHLDRGRETQVATLAEFRERDQAQASFGLLPVGSELADASIRNDLALGEFHRQIEDVVKMASGAKPTVPGVSRVPRPSLGRNQLYKCLRALQAAGRPLTNAEIQTWTNGTREPVLHNNANKVLKQYPALADRLEDGGERVRYRLTEAAHAYLRLAETRAAQPNE